jgi:DNA-binding transcriptional regulator LsrR (DeoR family)
MIYLARVASLYYDQDKTQQEIATELNITRSAISKLLTEARREGIVEIKVHYPWRSSAELEAMLRSTFGIADAKVLLRDNKSYDEVVKGLGILAAEYLNSILRPDIRIGLSWGTALYQMISALQPVNLPDAEVVQLLGATGAENNPTDGPLLAQLLANRLNCTGRFLHAPLIVESEAAYNAIRQDRNIQKALQLAREVDVAFVGIGSTDPELYSLARAGYVSTSEIDELRVQGAVGDICAHHFSIDGRILEIGINRRIVGISIEDMETIPRVVGVAGGKKKAETILGALRGGYVDVLITDEEAALNVLQMQLTDDAQPYSA